MLKPAGLVALVWNDRLKSGSRFAEGYEALLQRHATDYAKVDPNRTSGEKMDLFWAVADREAITMPHAQYLDRAALRGRVDSSSYVPLAGTPEHRAMHEELDGLFDGCAVEGRVAFEYVTCLFLGRPPA